MRIIPPRQVGGRALSYQNKSIKPVMITPQGAELSPEERAIYTQHRPYGFILFGRHCENPQQLKKLCADLKSTVGEECVIAIDQEGGRVARMREPEWPNFPAAAQMQDVYKTYSDLGAMLRSHGLTMNFAPCLDVVPQGGRADAIGDRCFSSDPHHCGQKGAACIQALSDQGIMPVIKHMPGHGRAVEDTHYFLPVVKASEQELQDDLMPFQMNADNKFGMTCHVIYEVWDRDHPATLSKTVIEQVIRGQIGFKGILFSDDLAMKALDRYGDIVTRVRLCLEAGCDIALPCNTTLKESEEILASLTVS